MHSLYLITLFSLLFMQDPSDCILGHYSHMLDKELTIYLSFYPDNVYSLTWEYEPIPDHYRVGYISIGKWQVINKNIVLTDSEHGFISSCTYKDIDLTSVFVRTNYEITIDQSFKWLMGLKFVKIFDLNDGEKPDMNDFPFDSDFNPLLAQKERGHYQSEKKLNALFFGDYASNKYQLYRLWIDSNQSYILDIGKDKYISPIIKENIFSEGTWERKGNVLVLYDTSVKCHFYLIITENGLKANQMMYSIAGIFPRSPYGRLIAPLYRLPPLFEKEAAKKIPPSFP